MTVARAALGARVHPLRSVTAPLPYTARWAAMAHISVVTVPAVLAAGGDARAYLAGAGVMARLGAMLGRGHSAAGRHATCTAGAPAAAVAAGLTAGGGQEAFGTQGKSLQAGFAADAGVRAARPAQAGATAGPLVLEAWLERVGGKPATDFPATPPVPGSPARCPAWKASSHRRTRWPRRCSTTVRASTASRTTRYGVRRRRRSSIASTPTRRQTGPVRSDGRISLRIGLADGSEVHTEPALPPGAPGRPPSDADLPAKAAACGPDVPALLDGPTWTRAAELPRKHFPYIPYESQET